MEIVDELPFKLLEVKYKWDIKGLAWRPEKQGECIVSPFFSAEGCPIEWALVLFPSGLIKEGRNVYVYLAAKECKLLSQSNYKTEADGFRATGYFNLYRVFQGKKEVFKEGREFFPGDFKPNDELKILVFEEPFFYAKPSRSASDATTKVDETWSFEVEIKIGISSKTSIRLMGPEMEEACKEDKMLGEALLEALDDDVDDVASEAHGDVSLMVGGVVLKAHRAVLAARSPVFAAMFKVGMSEAKTGVVKVEGVTVEVMKLLHRYIYTGSLDEAAGPAEVMELLVAAERYQLARLKARCEMSLIRSLKPENAAHLLILAEVHGAKHLKEGSLRYITSHIRKVFKTEGYKKLLSHHPHLLDLILQHLHGVQDPFHDFILL